jgi:23S rRNA pseudouridine1911/1915/1917 synthase
MMLGNLISRRLRNVDTEAARALVRAGGVYMGTLRIRVPTVRVRPGERITVYPEANQIPPLDPASIRVAYRDSSIMVVEKLPGVPVSATRASARGTLSEGVLGMLESEGVSRPYVGVIHRLDQGASGLVLITIRGVANKSLHTQFRDHEVTRTYRVRVLGAAPETLHCDAPLLEGRRPGATVRIAAHGEARARPATTRFRRVASVEGPETLMDVELVTGRTHQIRGHAAELGFPIKGDLHAWKLAFLHPLTGEQVRVESELPDWARADTGPFRTLVD